MLSFETTELVLETPSKEVAELVSTAKVELIEVDDEDGVDSIELVTVELVTVELVVAASELVMLDTVELMALTVDAEVLENEELVVTMLVETMDELELEGEGHVPQPHLMASFRVWS